MRTARRLNHPSLAIFAAVLALARGLAAQNPPATAADTPRQPFAEWIAGVREEALSRGIKPAVVDEALGHLEEPVPIVLERDRTQAETVLSLEAYIARHVKPAVVKTGRGMLATHEKSLNEVATRYGVPPSVIIAIWGMESNFGRFSGVRPTIAALATLAWDPRRSAFFRRELLDALEILDHGDITMAGMRGSWAGAMGQPQFMPSSYLKFAEDFDGDGRRDIWSTPTDVFASIGNYLKAHGWTMGEAWGREVAVSRTAAQRIAERVAIRDGTCQATRTMTVARPAKEWQELGVTLPGARPLPDAMPDGALVSGKTRRFLVFANYDALLAYNCAHSYAVSVAVMADAIDAPAADPPTPPPARRRRSKR